MQRQLAEPATGDMRPAAAALPPVCLKLVLRHFTLRQLSAAASVCRAWRALSEEHLSLVTHLDLEQLGEWRPAMVEQARARVRRAACCCHVGRAACGVRRVPRLWVRHAACGACGGCV